MVVLEVVVYGAMVYEMRLQYYEVSGEWVYTQEIKCGVCIVGWMNRDWPDDEQEIGTLGELSHLYN
jgi:hypothetical protein